MLGIPDQIQLQAGHYPGFFYEQFVKIQKTADRRTEW